MTFRHFGIAKEKEHYLCWYIISVAWKMRYNAIWCLYMMLSRTIKLLLKHLLNEPQVFVSQCHIVTKINGFSKGHILLFFYQKIWGNLGNFCFSSVNSTNFLGFLGKKFPSFQYFNLIEKKNCSKSCIVKNILTQNWRLMT